MISLVLLRKKKSKMTKFVAVMLCDDYLQMVIPENWFSPQGLDCNGYNESINRNIRRRIFYSPFGYDVEPDFTSAVEQEFRTDINACYIVRFLKTFPTSKECTDYVQRRRCVWPAVYNDRRLREYVNEIANGVADERNDVDPVADDLPPIADVNEDERNDADAVADDVAPIADVNRIANDVADERNDADLIADDVLPIADDNANDTVDETHAAILVVDNVSDDNANGIVDETSGNNSSAVAGPSMADASTANATTNPVSSFVAVIKTEDIKTEELSQIREANLNGETTIIDLTDDLEEQDAMIAVENNAELADSDDEFLVPIDAQMPYAVKFDFGSVDILSGDLPYKINVISSNNHSHSVQIVQIGIFFLYIRRPLKVESISITKSI